MPGFFITGTDTDAGKTFASCALLHALRAQGVRALGMKPVASGCEVTPQGLRNRDALDLMAASAFAPDYELVNPIALSEPCAPEFASRDTGIEITLKPMVTAFRQLEAQADLVLVEGIGGWLAPLSERLMQADLVRALQLPVLMVVGLRLGCINHALLTEVALRESGIGLAGWMACARDPFMLRPEENVKCLEQRLAAPCLGRVAWQADGNACAAASCLDTTGLLAVMRRGG
jgi:dethiobiotin synthetase